jgi:ceramide glucosyltransferase
VISDADIRVAPDYLAVIAGALETPGTGAVSCLYVGEPRAGFWSRLVAMGVSYGFLPNVVVGLALGAAKPCMGSTIALRRETLNEIGGFEAFADVLADDYEIGRAVRTKGLHVAIPPYVVSHGCPERTLGMMWAQELRWAVTIRSLSGPGHVGSVVTFPVALALLGAFLSGAPLGLGVTFLAAAIFARLWVMVSVDRATDAKSGPWYLLPVRDLAAFGVFMASLFAGSVDWRGARFRVSSSRKAPAA